MRAQGSNGLDVQKLFYTMATHLEPQNEGARRNLSAPLKNRRRVKGAALVVHTGKRIGAWQWACGGSW